MTEDVKEGVKKGNFLNKARGNLWMISTFALIIVLIGILLFKGGGAITGASVSADVAGEKLLSFVKAQGTGDAKIISTEKEGNLYKITMEYQEQEFPVYITLDGNYLISDLIPLNITTTQTQDNQEQQTTEVPKTDKPRVELFVMSLCPYGTQIEKGILPVANLLKDKIDFSVKFVYYAMHGKTEIDENTRQYCIQKEQKSRFNVYLACYLKEGKSDDCVKESAVDAAKLNACMNAADKQFNITGNFENQASWLSGQYPRYDVNLADNQKYQVGGSPTLVINGVDASSARDSASLLKAICAAFTTEPSECSGKLSSDSPSPGFGEGTGTASTASCG